VDITYTISESLATDLSAPKSTRQGISVVVLIQTVWDWPCDTHRPEGLGMPQIGPGDKGTVAPPANLIEEDDGRGGFVAPPANLIEEDDGR